jgi:hypothetical protein
MTPDGALQIQMKQGVAGKARIQVKASGSHLGLPALTRTAQSRVLTAP